MRGTILHVDMDAFFVSVELLRHPELRGQPVVVAGLGNRGVVAAANYEARVHGVFSAMPTARARRLCPHAVFLAGDHDRYAAVSERVMAIFRSVTPLVEPISLDEAFLDVTGARRAVGDGPTIARWLRGEIQQTEQLTCSVGVATSKLVAKLASEAAKPRIRGGRVEPGEGIRVVPPGGERDFLHPLPARALWGVGPKTWERLERLGVHTVGDIAGLPVDTLVRTLGAAHGRHLSDLSHAVDSRPVVPDQRPKSVGYEETFPHDLTDQDELGREVVRMADAVALRLRRNGLAGRTVTLKVRYGDFRTMTRSLTLPSVVDDTSLIARTARDLLAAVDVAPGIRLLGVSVSALSDGAARQLSFDELELPSHDDTNGAVDQIRERFGDAAIGPASSLGDDGLRIKRRGNAAWGPS
ncbi:MAG TPA: DNA polymerase IV [Acidimicrobiales bacterium]|jgi:DNA polymerase-4